VGAAAENGVRKYGYEGILFMPGRIGAVFWGLWGLIILLYLLWPLTHLDAYTESSDEGLYIQRAALANAGYPLYVETFFNKPPLLVWILQLAFKIGGESIAVARLAVLGLTLLGFVALGAVSGQLWGKWAGLVSMSLFLGLSDVPVRAYRATSDLPAMAFMLVAVCAALRFQHDGRRGWLALLGVAFTGGALIHPLLVYVAVPIGIVLFFPSLRSFSGRSARGINWLNLGILFGVMVGVVLLALLIVGWRACVDWVFRYNYQYNYETLSDTSFARNWDWIVTYLGYKQGLVGLAIVGLAALLVRPAKQWGVAVVVSWFLATVVTLLICSPLWEHYLVFLALPLSIVAGGGVVRMGGWIAEVRSGERRLLWWQVGLGALAIVAGVVFITLRWRETAPRLAPKARRWSQSYLELREFLETEVAPGTFVAADDPLLAFSAGHLVAPPLIGSTRKRIDAGYMTSGDAVEDILQYDVPIVVFSTDRLRRLPGFESWVAAVAAERRDFEDSRVYRLDVPFEAPNPVEVSFNGEIALHGYALSDDTLHPGEALTVTLFWERTGNVSEVYHVFVHLLSEDDQLWGQHDGLPLLSTYPTSQWADGISLPDPHDVPVRPDIPPGRYRLMVGMYRWPTLERLPALRADGSRWLHDSVVLTELSVSAQPISE
jgi:4-amino-4-deoxy-L-arabinose transferase-like glycosyltransferase